MTALAKSIIYTLTWFDIFDYPLTPDEVYWWLYNPTDQEKHVDQSQKTVKDVLNNELPGIVQTKDGCYFLHGRQNILLARQTRYTSSLDKMKRVKRLQQFLKYFPFIKMVALCDFMGYMNAREESDIDLFIITEKNRLFSARFWLTGILKILNLRPKLKTGFKKDKFCLSFWVAEDCLDLKQIALGFTGKDAKSHISNLGDIYFHYWLAGLKPIYDEDNYFQKFIQSNVWVKKYLPHLAEYYQNLNLFTYPTIHLLTFKKLFQKLQPQFLEKFFRWFQLLWMPGQLKALSRQQIGVIIRDNLLKLHWQDKRAEFRQKFINNLNNSN